MGSRLCLVFWSRFFSSLFELKCRFVGNVKSMDGKNSVIKMPLWLKSIIKKANAVQSHNIL